jgi:hypothetical protein
MGRVRSTHGERRNGYRILMEKPEGKSLHRRSLCRWEDNIERDLREMDYILLAQEWDQWKAFINMIMNLRVP